MEKHRELEQLTHSGLLPGEAKATERSLELPPDLTLDQWRRIGAGLNRFKDAWQFWVGDWVVYGEDRKWHSDKYAEAVEFTGRDRGTVMNWASVCRNVHPSIRRKSLSYTHHVFVAGLPPEDQAEVLEIAEQSKWNVRQLRQYLGQLPTLGPTFDPEREHTKIQWKLLRLGADMDFDVWVAPDDRHRSFAGQAFADIPRLLDDLPRQFSHERAHQTIRRIDVLWLRSSIVRKAFEIENSTAVYSGLLRMSDLVTLVPHLDIPLYVVAPAGRQDKVLHEVNRPTFASEGRRLHKKCRLIIFEELRDNLEKYGGVSHRLSDGFLDDISHSCEISEGTVVPAN